jgi:cell division protein FtsL
MNTAYDYRAEEYLNETGRRPGTARRDTKRRGEAEAKPATPARRGTATRQNAAPVHAAPQIHISAGEKVRMIIAVVFIGTMFLGVIFMAAYGASVQREINRVNADAAVLREDIDNLNLAIEKGRNIGTIEHRALAELGMIYPAGSQLKYFEEIEAPTTDLAQAIREHAYGSQ